MALINTGPAQYRIPKEVPYLKLVKLSEFLLAVYQFGSSSQKGKEEYLYSAILADTTLKSAETWITVLPANYTMSAFSS